MARFRERPAEVIAHQWFKNGDHPEDGPSDREGRVVRFFRRPDPEYAGTVVHDHCGWTWHDHGWIDGPGDGYPVCPGDWIVTDAEGKRYPCIPVEFDKRFEAID